MRLAPCAIVLVVACGGSPAPTPPVPGASATTSTSALAPRPNLDAALENLCAGPASIPLEIAGSREFVAVRIPGAKSTEPMRFHVDTGGNTPGLAMTRSAATQLGYADASEIPRTIRLGDQDVPLPEGASWTIWDDASNEKFDRETRKGFSVGQIGAGFLSRYVVCIDPGRARLGLGDPRDFTGDTKTPWVPLFLLSGGPNHAQYPFVHLLLLDPQGEFIGGYGMLLDTGATTSMIDRNKVDFQHKEHPKLGYAIGAFGDADMIGGQYAEKLIHADAVALNMPGNPKSYGVDDRVRIPLGPATFVDRPTGTWGQMFGEVKVTMGSHGAVANDVLLRHRLVLDYSRERLFVTPSAHAPDASASPVRVGISVAFGADGCPEVRQVTDTNAADTRAKLKIGDVIEAIDGKNACTMFHHELSAALAGAAGTMKKLHLRRAGAPLDVTVTTADLLAAH